MYLSRLLVLENHSTVSFRPLIKPDFPEYIGFQLRIFLALILLAFNLNTSPFFGLTRFFSVTIFGLLFVILQRISTIFLIDTSYPEPILMISPIDFLLPIVLSNAFTVSEIYEKSLVGYNDPSFIVFY